jgi:predicted RNase H-like HicB family nuclease
VRNSIECLIYRGERLYVAECLDFPVVTQGATLDEAVDNLHEAVALHLQGMDMGELGFASSPRLEVRLEVGELVCVS